VVGVGVRNEGKILFPARVEKQAGTGQIESGTGLIFDKGRHVH
jgi:hypothetical protein